MFSVPAALASAVNAAASYVYSNETLQDITQLMKDGTLDLSHLMTEEEQDYFTDAEPAILPQTDDQKQNYLASAVTAMGKLGRSLSSSITYLTTNNLDFVVSDTHSDVTAHVQLWLVNLKDPSCEYLRIRLDAFVTEFMNQQLPASPSDLPETVPPEDSSVSPPQFSSLLQPTDIAISVETQTTTQPVPEPKTPSDSARASAEYERSLQEYQEEAGKQIQAFIDDTVQLFKKHPFWHTVTVSREKEDILWECIERYILTQVYRRVNVANKLRDWKFYQLSSSFSFILPKHLDIKVSLPQELISECGSMLTNMNFYKTPRGKLICISNCCITIFNYLHKLGGMPCLDVNLIREGKSITADEFITVLTYIVIKTNPPSLVSNLSFINDFRHPKMLMSSWGYLASNLGVAIQFIFQLEPRLLSLGNDFDLEDDWALLKLNALGVPEIGEEKQDQTVTLDHLEEMKREKEETTGDFDSVSMFGTEKEEDMPNRYKYWNYCPDDLNQDDIPELLAEYKRLALLEYNLRMEKKKAAVLSTKSSTVINL